jgi:glycosyltransferase involved in cell wall biosynthesis
MKLKLSGVLEYRGHVAHDEVLRCIAAADVCVCPFPKLPALEYAYALKIPEYLAMGKVVVATDLECNRGLIRNEENGILTTDNSPEELCGALHRLYRDKELREKLESNARGSVKHLDWGQLLAQLNRKISHLALQP